MKLKRFLDQVGFAKRLTRHNLTVMPLHGDAVTRWSPDERPKSAGGAGWGGGARRGRGQPRPRIELGEHLGRGLEGPSGGGAGRDSGKGRKATPPSGAH